MSDGRNLGRLGALIGAKRQDEGLGLRAAADQSGVSPSTLSRLERGVGAWPDADTMAKLSNWLNVSVGDLLFGEDVTKFEEAKDMTTPEIIAVHLRADKKLSREEADALVELLRLAYAQFVKKEKE